MNVDKYNLKTSSKGRRYEFISEGPKGAIRKLIEFQETQDEGLFNLAFGDKAPMTDEIDDLSVTNNGDAEKVLATVVAAVYAFCDQYPDAYIYASGSTKSRTRLYYMGITKYPDQCSRTFICSGKLAMTFPYFNQVLPMTAFWHYANFLNLQTMKNIQDISKRKVPIVAIDTALDKYEDKIMFPKKLERANKMLKTAKLPPKTAPQLTKGLLPCRLTQLSIHFNSLLSLYSS